MRQLISRDAVWLTADVPSGGAAVRGNRHTATTALPEVIAATSGGRCLTTAQLAGARMPTPEVGYVSGWNFVGVAGWLVAGSRVRELPQPVRAASEQTAERAARHVVNRPGTKRFCQPRLRLVARRGV